ncbi:UPF0688 protein C1orf174 homolog [Nerophis lumbriciformis]|uniref:UPF0688 protein C1orf174 homolog n=1 Tax=Nerophis lumbriciformis TaxID=546530 RepID=UPI002AE0394C|nr:UPF0688 protein C1orf174 homolog [Nerophis lumbriciformis]
MIRKMPGQLNKVVMHRKRKSVSEPKNSKKVSVPRRKCVKSPKALCEAESSSVASAKSKAAGDTSKRLSHISCECLLSAGRQRCSASPLLDGQDGKENDMRTSPFLETCAWYGVQDMRGPDNMECQESDKNVFPDDDSNQILPVEQFFGNLDELQDFPQRTSATTSRHQRRHRRRHYYALEDSDEEQQQEAEAGLSSTQQEDTL